MRKTSIYNPRINAEIKTNLLTTLDSASMVDMPTVDWIKRNNIILSNFPSQKLSRSLNELWEMGIVVKAKGKDNRMVYRLRSSMEEAGYEVDV